MSRYLNIVTVVFAAIMLSHPAYAFDDVSKRLVGEWRNTDAHFTVIITKDGNVFAQGGPVYGAVAPSIASGGNFEFQNSSTQCNYNIAFLGDGSTDWGLVYEKTPGSCLKGGHFAKTADFSNPDASKAAPDKGDASLNSDSDGDQSPTKNAADDAVDPGPSELAGVTVSYFNKVSDGSQVTKALNRAKVRFSSRAPENGESSNAISCSDDVSIEAIRKLASVLIKGGVELKAIAPSVYADQKGRLTIEHLYEYDNYSPLSLEDVSKISSCPNLSSMPKKIMVRNACEKTSIDIYARYYSPALNKWVVASARVPFGKRLPLRKDGLAAWTNKGYFYYYAHGVSTNTTWYDYKSGYNFPLPGGEVVGYIKSQGESIALSCPDE